MKAKLTKIAVLMLIIVGISLVIINRDKIDVVALQHWVDSAGAAGPIVFMILYAIGTIFFFPGSVLTLAGGAIFGPVLGTFINLTGATIGATIAFIISRYLASNWVEHKTAGVLKQLKQGVEGEGWRFVVFVRLVPLFPFNILNYALGLTRIKLSHYIIASYISMLPGAIAYTYLGYAGREAVSGGQGTIQKALLALSLLAIVAFIPRIITRYRQGPMMSVAELKQQLDKKVDVLILDVRTSDDFVGEQHHIVGATNIPLENLPEKILSLSDSKNRNIALVCRTDRRSAKAAQLLRKNGFTDVRVIKGGMTDWNNKSYTIE